MSVHGTAWPNVLADLIAKRDALTTIIDMIRTHFVGDEPGEMPESVPARGAGTNKRAAKKDRQTDRQTEQASRQPAARSLPKSPTEAPRPRLDIVPARDAAVLDALKKGPKPSNVLLEALPKEPGQTPGQRDDALRNSLTRLRVKKAIKRTDSGEWTLV